ncbi:kinase-like protein [Eremomyces bilateralis CBS 781.70]|uniref:EKC/KEOPS complex subunit BUD32 n=1 Tax=Eremomyces bilateralis CBS 781.70 TaxID=1392243 RepID=A0A6G1GB39_9PEZI|nr:kinase-like protein [Eremomyces bilateralis CBS 781.70]KAF1815253.1 kinase-like protein [Eremomyces bilateralis CBS 781.70]
MTLTTAAVTTAHTLPPPFTSPTSPPLDLRVQGAESLLYKTTLLTPSLPCALKYRPPKAYRHATLDRRLTKARLLAEARVLVRCRRDGVTVPGVLGADWETGWIALEWVEGRTVREVLDGVYHVREHRDAQSAEEKEGKEGIEGIEKQLLGLMRKVGVAVGKLHSVGVCHGDLTTSNLMLRPRKKKRTTHPGHDAAEAAEAAEADIAMEALRDAQAQEPEPEQELDGDVVLIDFGLANQTVQDEDKAVDLYVLERAFGSTHPQAEHLFQEVLNAYGENYKAGQTVLRKLDQVRMRGRKKSMLG